MISFDYSQMFPKDHFYSYFTNPLVPIVSVVLYLLFSNIVFNGIKNLFGLTPKGPVIQSITILHSAFLAIYSGWTFYHSFNIVGKHILEHGFVNALCDTDNVLWNQIGWWMTHFYISKYYEFIDTWIVLLKGRTPIFLQTYHHAGIVILMWGFIVTRNTSGVVILVLNSFIHTLMYTYYTLSAFGYSSPLKHYLTQAQMIQFVTGIGMTAALYFFDGCLNQGQTFVLASVQLYAVGLIYLFAMFYIKSYSKKGSKSKDNKEPKDD